MIFQSKLSITTRGRGTTNISEAIREQVQESAQKPTGAIFGATVLARPVVHRGREGGVDHHLDVARVADGDRFLDGVDAAVRQHLDDPRAAGFLFLATDLPTLTSIIMGYIAIADLDAVWDADEPALDGWTLFLDTDDDGVGDTVGSMAFGVNAIPIAGDFNTAHPGDEIGAFDGMKMLSFFTNIVQPGRGFDHFGVGAG